MTWETRASCNGAAAANGAATKSEEIHQRVIDLQVNVLGGNLFISISYCDARAAAGLGFGAGCVVAGAWPISDTCVPPPKITRLVSIKDFLDFSCCCLWLSAAINFSLRSGRKSVMNRLVFRKRAISKLTGSLTAAFGFPITILPGPTRTESPRCPGRYNRPVPSNTRNLQATG